MKRVFIVLGSVVVVAALTGVGLMASYLWNNTTTFSRGMDAVTRAGFVEKQANIAGHTMHYAEGPDRGPALLLIHGQSVDWKNYTTVLPEVASRYHVFAVDCWGHGGSDRVLERYTAAGHGADLGVFIEQVIGAPVLVAGHSSGGHLAAWLGAYGPEEVRGVLLEDPPFFTTTLPRAATTWNYVDLATTAHTYLESGRTDWPVYSVEHARMWRYFGDGARGFLDDARAQLAANPQGPVVWAWLPAEMNEAFRGLPAYDPRFGEAFYATSWDDGWDQAQALAAIRVPATLVHTKVSVDDEGILQAAMGHEDADRARGLIRDVVFHKVETGHGYHRDDPRDYIAQVDALRSRALP